MGERQNRFGYISKLFGSPLVWFCLFEVIVLCQAGFSDDNVRVCALQFLISKLC